MPASTLLTAACKRRPYRRYNFMSDFPSICDDPRQAGSMTPGIHSAALNRVRVGRRLTLRLIVLRVEIDDAGPRVFRAPDDRRPVPADVHAIDLRPRLADVKGLDRDLGLRDRVDRSDPQRRIALRPRVHLIGRSSRE